MAQRQRQTQQRQWPFQQRLNQIGQIDRFTLAIIASGIAILGTIFFPKIIPAAKQGIQCYDLPSPIGGNNRSLLAQVGNDSPSLELNIDLANTTIGLNENLKVKVTFVNHDIGPAILFLDSKAPLISTDQYAVGLRFEITQINGNPLLNQPVSNPWTSGSGYARINSWADPNYLHLLGSRSRCTLSFQYNLNQTLLNLGQGLPPGDYRIRAYYYNNNMGSVRPFNIDEPTATATPAYTDQGLWTGQLSSSEIRFTVRGP